MTATRTYALLEVSPTTYTERGVEFHCWLLGSQLVWMLWLVTP